MGCVSICLSVSGDESSDPCTPTHVNTETNRSLDAEVVESHIQKLRSFRYQMKNTLAGDNLDTPDELAKKGILPNGELSMSLEHHRDGSISLTRCVSSPLTLTLTLGMGWCASIVPLTLPSPYQP